MIRTPHACRQQKTTPKSPHSCAPPAAPTRIPPTRHPTRAPSCPTTRTPHACRQQKTTPTSPHSCAPSSSASMPRRPAPASATQGTTMQTHTRGIPSADARARPPLAAPQPQHGYLCRSLQHLHRLAHCFLWALRNPLLIPADSRPTAQAAALDPCAGRPLPDPRRALRDPRPDPRQQR